MTRTETTPHTGQIWSTSVANSNEIAEPKDTTDIYQQFKERWASLIYRISSLLFKSPSNTGTFCQLKKEGKHLKQ